LHPLYFPNTTDIRAIPKISLIRSSAAANAEVSTSAIKPIFAIFWNFDGVGQLIATKLLTKRVWISSWQGVIQIDCVSEVYPKEIDYHQTGVTDSEAGTFVVFKNYDYSNPIPIFLLHNLFSALLFPHDGPLTAVSRVQRIVQSSGFPSSLKFDGFMECHVYSEVSVPLE
jgi:hypothetical protein